MFKRNAIYGVIIAASSINLAHAQLEEVIVTATKTASSTQDIPIAVTALGEESLQQLGISDFSDYLIHLPGVTAGGGGPGTNTIYIRGVASTTPNLTTSGVAGLAPNVAFYLDEQPLTQPGRNLDVYAADLNRIEVLKGPQGTLFGASSQAGTVRMITNKPDPSAFSGKLKMGAAYTPEGDPSHNVEGVVNIPIADNMAVRAVVYVDNQGGYIDNVAGTETTRQSARFQAGGFQEGADLSAVDFRESNNSSKTEDNFNEVSYSGFRLSGLWDINDDWTLLLGVAQQSIDSEGVFYQDPELEELEVSRYENDTLDDDFENYNWTLTGRMGTLDLLYTGAYTERESQSQVDYTDYLNVGQYIPYYICDYSVSYPGDAAPAGTCYAPNLFIKSYVKSEVQTHEFRISTDQSGRLRGLGGVFYSDMELREDNQFTYPNRNKILAADGVTVGWGPNFSAQPSSARDPGQWSPDVSFRNDVLRTDKQLGVFGELNFDISDQFTLTAGARWYDIEVDLKGSAASSFGNLGSTESNNSGQNLDELFSGENDVAKTDGVIGKVSLTWTPNQDQLYYVTWSEGYRPGFLNRPGGRTAPDGSYTVPFAADTDEVTNYEFGWKLDLLDDTLRFNGDIFFVDITDLQVGIFDTSITNLFFADNAADAEVKGVEGEFTWLPQFSTGLTVSGGFSLLDTEVTDSFVTSFVREGDSLPFAPEVQATLNGRYEWDVASGRLAHVMGFVSYSDKVNTDIVAANSIELDSWYLLGVTAGLSDDQWTAELYVENLTDERAEISGNAIFNVSRVTVARPRTIGLRFAYDF
ncbi:TonB-dependent receptor [Halieaceae bacterium IMCC14734]|uniref:TonB-dependent receptor n=1 Tax=Candidatus Litorirhabdus singularis TaxID=2518993 RepID=A0ABT3TEC1_9GAMM|nr:TonB-dependent receptor [Candidatus Litorirhabdus singularis]MCX2980604.1 TonB-dependent receptor [Candidatus Litorirhabdus singularis]